MKKIKTIFYSVYILYIAFSVFIGLYYENLVLRWEWDWIDTWVSLIRFVMKMGAIGVILLILQMVLENLHIHFKNKQIVDLENQVTELKAKLYDKSDEKNKEVLNEKTEITSNENEESNTKS